MASPGPSKRSRFSCSVNTALHTWELEARRKLAMWRKQLQPTKALVHAHFLVECTKKGVNLETLLKETSVDRDIQRAATLMFVNQDDKQYEMWEGHIQRLELVVYSLSLLYAAQKSGDKHRDTL